MSYILTDEQVRVIMSALFIRSEQLASYNDQSVQMEKEKIDSVFSELVYQQKC